MTQEISLADKWSDLGFDLQLCSHYHLERRRFFERWSTWSSFLGVVLGSATIASMIHDQNVLATVIALILTIIQGLDLVVGFSRMAWTHGDFMRRFIDLENEWRRTEMSHDAYVRLENVRRDIEKDEPAPMPYLVELCHIAIMRRQGRPKDEWPKLKPWQRHLANYWPSVE